MEEDKIISQLRKDLAKIKSDSETRLAIISLVFLSVNFGIILSNIGR